MVIFKKVCAIIKLYLTEEKGGMGTMRLQEETVSSETLYDGKIICVKKDQARLENGKITTRELVCHPGGVCIVALTDQEEVYMVRQFRYPYHRVLLELPAGKLNRGEDPLECGKRELEEETGMTARHYENLGDFYPTVGYVDEILYTYLATGLEKTYQHLDENEFLDVELIPLKELYRMVMNGEIQDGKTQTAILKTYCRLHGEQK
ncbi:MAG: NUDIX domain-containing protein [Massiliimalia sp.]